MQIIKYLLFLVVLAIVSVGIYISTLDNRFNIENNYTVPYKKIYIKNYFNDIVNWDNISHIEAKDTLVTNDDLFEIQRNVSIKLDSVSPNLSLFSVYLGNENIGKMSYKYTDTINKSTKIDARFYGEVTFLDKINIFLKGISPGNYFGEIFNNVNEKMQEQLKADFSYTNFSSIKMAYIPKTYYYKSRFADKTISREKIISDYQQLKTEIREENITSNSFFIDLVIDSPNRKEYFIGIPVKNKLTNQIGTDIFLDSLRINKVVKTAYSGDIEFENRYFEFVKTETKKQNLHVEFSNKIKVWNSNLKLSNPKNWTFETWYALFPEVKQKIQPRIVTDSATTVTNTNTP